MAAALAAAGREVVMSEDIPTSTTDLDAVLFHEPSLGPSFASAIRRMPRRGRGPSVFVFAVNPTSEERARWLECGAADIIDGRQTCREYLARIVRVLSCRRPALRQASAGPFRVDADSRRAWAGSRELRLTPTEFNIFALLVANADRALSHEEIRASLTGGDDLVHTSGARTHIHNLRTKLGPYARLLEAVVPRQYRLRTDLVQHKSTRAPNRGRR